MQHDSYFEPEPDATANAVAAEMLQRVALDDSGALFDDNDPATWAEADAATPEIVSRGQVRFRIIDSDATDLAVAVGAIEPGARGLCLRVEFEAGSEAPAPAIGEVVVISTDAPGVSLTFGVWATHADLNDPAAPELADAVPNDLLDAIGRNQGLLVQALDDADGEAVQ